MISKNTSYITSQQTLSPKQVWNEELKETLDKIKRPFLERVADSKLRIENKRQDIQNQKKQWIRHEGLIECLIQKVLNNELPPARHQNILTEQSQDSQNHRNSQFKFQQYSDYQNQPSLQAQSHLTEWQGRDKSKIFKNSSNIMQQFQRVFDKKIGVSQQKKKASFSYRKEQREMLERIFAELKHVDQNFVEFYKMYKFFHEHKLFYTVYGINPAELQDVVSSSAHKYPDKLTREQFLDLFLVNVQSRAFDELQAKTQKICCLQAQNWTQLNQLFHQLDTFGRGTVNSKEFFHKMKTVSPSKQLLQAKTMHFTSVNRYYSFSKILFELENKMNLPQYLSWTQLQSMIINFSHIDYPAVDEIFQQRIRKASIQKDTNSFLLKEDTLSLLKKHFQRCPKFSEHFVKCKYFFQELLFMEAIHNKRNESVRQDLRGKGFISLRDNIRLMQAQAPQYLDMDQMLTYFSVRGFSNQLGLNNLRESFDTNSTASDEEFQDKKREERRVKRMKSEEQMKKIINNKNHMKHDLQSNKVTFQPVKVQQFNLTKPRDHLTIRQQKVKQMIQEKQRIQRQQQRPFVPANPIPASINSQRYLQQRNKELAKRELERERHTKKYDDYQQRLAYLETNTKLFQKRDHLEREKDKIMCLSPQPKKPLESKPIQWFVKERNLLDVIEGEKEERRKNRLKETQEKYVYGYWKDMPYQNSTQFKRTTVQNLDQAKSDGSLVIQTRESSDGVEIQKPKTTIVPDFVKLQREFMEELQSKKKMRSPTIVKQFNLSVSKKKQPQVQEEKILKRPQTPKKLNNQTKKKDDKPIIVGTTKKYEGMVELTQLKIAHKKYQAQLKVIEEKQRKNKQKIFAKYMSKALRQESYNRPQSSQRTTRNNNHQKNCRNQQENELNKIYERVLARPFLFQTACSQSQGLTRKRRKNSQKKTKKQVPRKVHIPNERGDVEIPPLKYIQEEQYQADYQYQREHQDQEQEYIVREFDCYPHQQEEQSYDENLHANMDKNQARYSAIQKLNQSF